MSRSKKTYSDSDAVRKAFRRARTEHQVGLDPNVFSNLDDLVIDKAMLADESTGLVLSKYLRDDNESFILSVPHWFFSDADTVRIEHSRDGLAWTVLHEETVEYFDIPINDPHPIKLDKSKDAMKLDGKHFFRSWIRNDADDVSVSKPLELVFDRLPPYKNVNPVKFPDIPVVTDASLANGNDKVTLSLPAYSDWEAGDVVYVYWMNHVPDKFEDLDPPVATVPTTAQVQAVEIPGDAVRKVGDGGVFVLYVLLDKAQNVSALSFYTSISVALGTLPTTLKDPLVPLATAQDGYLIDQADAAEGVEVWVPLYDGMKATDFVQVKWGTTSLDPETVGSAPGQHIRVLVDDKVMLQEYGDFKGAKDTNVSYTLLRGTHPLGNADTDIKVDFETMDPGGPGTGWPDPIHPKLKPVVIKGQGGTSADNELNIDDNKLPADLEVELYDFIEENDKLTFYWAGEEAASYTVKATDSAGDTITVEVPWRFIHEGGNNPTLPVDYEARRAGVHNPVQSAVTSVAVDAITITPIASTFAHLTGSGLISCASIQATAAHPKGPAVEVLVPDLTEYKAHSPFNQVALKWWVYEGRSDKEGFIIIDQVTLEETITLDDEHPITGFTWRVPYATNVRPTYDGSDDPDYARSRANVTYTLKMDKGDVLSETAKVTLAFIPPSKVCDPNGTP